MKQTVAEWKDLIMVHETEEVEFHLWNRGYLIGKNEWLSDDDINLVKHILNEEKKAVIEYKIYTLKPTTFIHSEVIKQAIHIIRIHDLPNSGKIPEGYYFISQHPIVFDSHWYDDIMWKEIREKRWKVKIGESFYQHWKIYIYYPPHHLYKESPPFIVDYSIIPMKKEDKTKIMTGIARELEEEEEAK